MEQSVPSDVRQAESIDSFKRDLNSFYFKRLPMFLMATTFVPLK